MTNEQAPDIQLDSNIIITDLTEQIARLSREKATQVAITKKLEETTQQVIESAQKFEENSRQLTQENQLLQNEIAQLRAEAKEQDKKPRSQRGKDKTNVILEEPAEAVEVQ